MKIVSDKVVRHSLAYLSVQKMVRALLRENLPETETPHSKTPISNQYSLVAPQP